MQDFELATAQLKELGTCITIFGFVRTAPSHQHYNDTVTMAKGLAEAGYGIIIGGGGGIMEAGNKGAFLKKGPSVGLSIYLPFKTRKKTPIYFEEIRFQGIKKNSSYRFKNNIFDRPNN